VQPLLKRVGIFSALAAVALAGIFQVSQPSFAANGQGQSRHHTRACKDNRPDRADCLARFVSDEVGRPFISSYAVAGMTPAQARKAYGFDQIAGTGAGQTIAIVDAYGSPTIQNDLAVFNAQFGLPSANLQVVTVGCAPPNCPTDPSGGGWALETALDVAWAHAIAPDAKILLVVAKDSYISSLLAAVDYATNNGATVVSMSWGAGEFSSQSNYDYHFKPSGPQGGITYTASSGDGGHAVSWPAASPAVVAVGGTYLALGADGSYLTEAGWSGSGGGVSLYSPVPTYQQTLGKIGRAVPDVSYNGDPNSGFAVYSAGNWYIVGGTSAGAPQWAGLFALVKQSGPAALYPLATNGYRDITSGTNGTCGADCTAFAGYDLVTGLGSPRANSLVPALSGVGTGATPSPTASTPTATATNTAAPTATTVPTATPTPTLSSSPAPKNNGNGIGRGRR
jgi:subtilase family serine protease